MPGFLPLLLIAIVVIVAIAIVVFLRRRRREAQEAATVHEQAAGLGQISHRVPATLSS